MYRYQYNNLYTLSTNSGYMLGSEQPGSDVAHLVSNSDFGGTRSTGITYMTPKMDAFQLTYQHGAVGSNRETQEFLNAAANTANGRTQDNSSRDSFLLDYANGPLKASAAYTKVQVKQSVGTNQATCTVVPTVGGTAGTATCVTNIYTFSILNAATYASAVPAAADYDSNLAQLGARYDMGSVRFAGTYNKGTKSNTGGTTVSTNAYQGGVEGVYGAMRPFFKMGKAKVSTDGASTNSFKESQMGIRYDLSKRTLVYVMTGSVKDDVVASSSASVARRAATAVGLYHSF
jgi:predicted porin